MQDYQFLKRGSFESLNKFEKRLNELSNSGWKAIAMTEAHGVLTILMERIKR